MYRGHTVAVIIPALNEALTIGGVVAALDRDLVDWIVVGDNGSCDGTAERATAAGALVVSEPRRGYGSACLAAIAAVPQADILVFLDGDGSDEPAEMVKLLDALFTEGTEIVIGSRNLGRSEPGALTPVQRFGNVLTCGLVRLFWGVRYTDLGPFRALRKSTYDRLRMCDPDYGWTVEMQVKAARAGLRTMEVPVTSHRRQGGASKVSGTIAGSWRAGKRILGYVFAAKWAEIRRVACHQDGKLVVLTRFPEPGQVKTRLVPLLGPQGAADLHRVLTEHTLKTTRVTAAKLGFKLEVFHTGPIAGMQEWLGHGLTFRPQTAGDLGRRMTAALDTSAGPVVLVGADCPALDGEILAAARDALRRTDVVLGPAADGGFYLIGTRRPLGAVLLEMTWGHDRVLAEVCDRLRRAGLDWEETKTLPDIDRPEDLAFLPAHLRPRDDTTRNRGDCDSRPRMYDEHVR